MRLLWLTNKIIPQVDEARGVKVRTVNEGWISHMFNQLVVNPKFSMSIICMGGDDSCLGHASNYQWEIIKTELKEEIYYSYDIEIKLLSALKRYKPDIIHIWGTEYPHTLAMINSAEKVGLLERVVVSLQGIMYMCAIHYLNGIPANIINKKTLYDFIRGNSLKNQQRHFQIRGESEIMAFHKIHHVIGRTSWDKYCVERINPSIVYHHCDETLRETFYTGCWKYSRCRKHSIFMSQATYPIKGMHYLLQALPKLIGKYPDLVIYVAGNDITKTDTIIDKLKLSSYGLYLKRMINMYGLNKYIHFLGKLDASQMKHQYLSANVFVSPSLIENSSNSIGEAMLIGCPVVCSNVGGVSSIIENNIEGFTYPVDEFYMLEYFISKIFDMKDSVETITANAKYHARLTHDPQKNIEALTRIYNEIIE